MSARRPRQDVLSTTARWIDVDQVQPHIAEAVLIAYRFDQDDELTVDCGERDLQGWKYLGGGYIDRHGGQVYYWAPLPQPPGLPESARVAA